MNDQMNTYGDSSVNGQNQESTSNGLNPRFNFDKFGISNHEINCEDEKLLKDDKESQEDKGLFKVKTANRWIEEAKIRPIPKMLFDEFWYEGEICILFADTNLGKSILAVQIANSISMGKPIEGFMFEANKQSVLYFDFELSEKQFEKRYSIMYQDHYTFDDNFYRIEINPDSILPEDTSFEDFLNDSLERSIIETGSKILIIDNLTYLRNENERAKDALPLMKDLKALKKKYGLSILALAHTPKRNLSKPLTKNDLQGSKMLMNFCDSAFAIGESQSDINIRYLKQIKVRQSEFIYDSGRICICQIDKPLNFLLFAFMEYGSEWEHLRQPSENDIESLQESIVDLKQKGRSFREIGATLEISHMRAKRIYDKCNKV